MADIDKSLPNVEQEIKVPSPEEVEVAQEQEQQKINEEGNPCLLYTSPSPRD